MSLQVDSKASALRDTRSRLSILPAARRAQRGAGRRGCWGASLGWRSAPASWSYHPIITPWPPALLIKRQAAGACPPPGGHAPEMVAAESTSASCPSTPASRWIVANSRSRFSSVRVLESAKPLRSRRARGGSSTLEEECGSCKDVGTGGRGSGHQRRQGAHMAFSSFTLLMGAQAVAYTTAGRGEGLWRGSASGCKASRRGRRAGTPAEGPGMAAACTAAGGTHWGRAPVHAPPHLEWREGLLSWGMLAGALRGVCSCSERDAGEAAAAASGGKGAHLSPACRAPCTTRAPPAAAHPMAPCRAAAARGQVFESAAFTSCPGDPELLSAIPGSDADDPCARVGAPARLRKHASGC